MMQEPADVDRLQEQLVDLQCRYMDLQQLVESLDEVVRELGDQLYEAQRERDALRRRLSMLEQGGGQPGFG